MLSPSRLLRLAVFLVALWALLVYVLPPVRATIPLLCIRWKLTGGFCTERAARVLGATDGWVQRVLRPLPQHGRVRQASADIAEAFQVLERAVRERVGDREVDAAVQGAEIALARFEGLLGSTGDARSKVAEIPDNAGVLLARLRSAFENLRAVLGSSSRRAEEVSQSLEETRNALDAFSKVLPKARPSPP